MNKQRVTGKKRGVEPPTYDSDAGAIFAENLEKLKVVYPNFDSDTKIGHASGVQQTTVSNYIKGRSDPQLKKIERIAKVFGLKAWQALKPVQDMRMLTMWKVYNEASEQNKKLIDAVIQMAEDETKNKRP